MKTNWCFLKKAVSVCPGFCAFPLRSSPAPLCLLSVCLSLPLRLSAILPANFIGRSCAHRSHMALISQVSPSCVHYRNCPEGGQSLPRVFFFLSVSEISEEYSVFRWRPRICASCFTSITKTLNRRDQ